jgi:putative two-component system response regulator
MNASPRATVLLVDDTPQNLALMTELLQNDYDLMVANNGVRALHLAQEVRQPDIVLLDIMMPGLDGYEVLRRLKADPRTHEIPVMFLTARAEVEDETRGLQLGAVDYITKPINPSILLARVRTQLMVKASADFLRDKAAFLESQVARRTREIETIQDVTVLAMSSMAETRDNETGNHILRTQRYVRRLAEVLRPHPRFTGQLGDGYIQLLFKSAPLHDIGKVGVPDHILLKPGRLTPEEFERMKSHTTIGYESIVRAEKALGTEVEFLRVAKEIALCHHEKWNGSGYPRGLSGDDIPLSARLMAVADVYDALINKRVYKPSMTHESALDIMREGRGIHFDPDVFDAFISIEHDFRSIAGSYTDAEDAH